MPLQVAAIAGAGATNNYALKTSPSSTASATNVLVKGLHELGWMVETPKRRCTSGPIPEQYAAMGSLEFAKKLLLEAKVCVSPRIGFGEYGDDHVRFALKTGRIRQAVREITRHVQGGWVGQAKPDLILKKPNQCGGWLARCEHLGVSDVPGDAITEQASSTCLLHHQSSNMMNQRHDRQGLHPRQVLNVSATVMLKYCLTSQNPRIVDVRPGSNRPAPVASTSSAVNPRDHATTGTTMPAPVMVTMRHTDR